MQLRRKAALVCRSEAGVFVELQHRHPITEQAAGVRVGA
jgi:hypothetical protein